MAKSRSGVRPLKFIEHRACSRRDTTSRPMCLPTCGIRSAALRKVRRHPRAEIADVLLDQSIFAGVGNIIKNEVLFRTRTSPMARVGRPLGAKTAGQSSRTHARFHFAFSNSAGQFALRKNLEIYGRSVCPSCGGRVSRKIHGDRARRSFFCVDCQKPSV